MHEKRRHYRVALRELRENPDKGVYITEGELKKYGIFAGIVLFLLAVVSLFRK